MKPLHRLAGTGTVVSGVLTVVLLGNGGARLFADGLFPPGAMAQILAVHNRERLAVGTPPLRWDDGLAISAQHCARHLAASRQFRHCRSGENLWMGTAGRFSPTQMAELWAAEKHDFQAGTFPAVSRGEPPRPWAVLQPRVGMASPAWCAITPHLGKSSAGRCSESPASPCQPAAWQSLLP